MSVGLHRRVAEAVVSRGLWRGGQRVAVAVSGGLDSVALLHLLHASRGIHGGRLGVVTVDHGTRPGSADDAAFVVALAERLGLPCTTTRLDLCACASEASLRAGRYGVLDGVDADVVALAHHRDDQSETVVLGMLRGGGTLARAGMAWRRDRYVRPLLDTPRAVLRDWAVDRGLSWREDPTNAELDATRNRVRHEVLPLLDAVRPGASATLARSAAHAAADEDLLARLAAEADPWDGCWPTPWIASAPAPLVRRVLLARLPHATAAHLDAVRACARRGRGRVALSHGVAVLVDARAVSIVGV